MGKLQGNGSFFVPGPPAKPGNAYQPIVKFILESVKGNSILDLGGGEGAYSLELKNAGYDVVVADIYSESLSIAEKHGLKTMLITQEDSLEENVADNVIMIEVLEHVPDPKDFMKSAIKAAKKRVIFTLPCTNDFKLLFDVGLSYNHIAVSDHLWHYSYDELKFVLDSLGVNYKISMGDYLFPKAIINILRKCCPNILVFKFLKWSLLIFNKLGLISKQVPSRFYGIIEK